MVVASAVAQLRLVAADPGADGRRVAEIKRRSRHRSRRPGKRNGVGIDREKAIGENSQTVIEDVLARRRAFQIEETVVGQVDDRGAVGTGFKTDRQFGRPRQAIADADIQLARIALLAVGADIGERYARLGAFLNVGDLPQLPVEAVRPAMQRMPAVIGCQLHRSAVENEARVRDTIGVAADGRAKEAPIGRDSL